MSQKVYSFIAGVIFLLVAILHGSRLGFGWEAVVGGWVVPMWISWGGLVAALILAYLGFKFSREAKKK